MKRAVWLSILIAVIALAALAVSFPVAARFTAPAFAYNPLVAAMITQVQSNTVYAYAAQLSGETAVLIGGVPYTITTRHTTSGMPVQQATQFVYEQLQQHGLAVSFHNWSSGSYSNRNVVGVLTGTLKPSEIVLVTAHLDDMPSSGRAPGADDNASGSVGVLLAADIMSHYHFGRTVRFVFFTGEEQGLYGSAAYANIISSAGDNIVAVYNLDMIAWDSVGGPTLRLHTRTTSNPGYASDLAIAGVFTNVVNTYGLSSALTPIIDPDGESASDHASFWNKGYSAILAIEDDVNDFNAYYHTLNDNLTHINLTYFTNFVRASIGTAAHLAQPLSDYGVLQGSVMDASTAQPIGLAQVSAAADVTRTGSTAADNTGQYTLLLLDGTYTATASAYGYAPAAVGGITIVTGITTTQNLSLTAVAVHTVTGQVRDALTDQPLSATISIGGYPYGPIATDATGTYQVALAEGITYTFQVQASEPGYLLFARSVGPLTTNRVEDFALQADLASCLAPGYTLTGVSQSFDTPGTPPGWSAANNVGSAGWRFDDPKPRTNLTGGAGNFAIADSDYAGSGVSMDTELRTPVLNLSTLTAVTLTFKTDFHYYSTEVADVDVSVNGAAGPWTNVWRKSGADYRGPHTETINLTALLAGQPNAMLRFHYYNAVYEWWWEVDDVRLGQCNLPAAILNPPVLTPETAAQAGTVGTWVTYTLNLSNTDLVSHTFDVQIADNAWPTNAITPIGPVAAHAAQSFTVTVAIPGNALAHSLDTANISVLAQDSQVLSATAALTTTAYGLPIITPPTMTQAGGSPAELDYALKVTNTDTISHVYEVILSGYGDAWATTPVGPVPPHSIAPFTVTIGNPPYAGGNTASVVSATVQAQDNPVLSATAVLTAVVTPYWEVRIDPTVQSRIGAPGTTAVYRLKVYNVGNLWDVYNLTLEDNHWPTSLSVTQTLVNTTPRVAGAVEITAFVTIPLTATAGLTDVVRISATGTGTTAYADLMTTAGYQIFLPLISK